MKFVTAKKQLLAERRVLSLDEIRQLYDQAQTQERAYLLLGLNCGYGRSEILALKPDNLLLRRRHPHAESLGFESTPQDSFVRFRRPKTGALMEHLLWTETAEVLLELIYDGVSDDLIFPQGRQGSSSSWHAWHRLIRRVQQVNPGFPVVPFGALRWTGAHLLGNTGADDETLRLFLGHTVPIAERHVASPSFGRLVRAIRKVEEFVSPALTRNPAVPG